MILHRRLLEQCAGRSVVPGPAIAFGQHHAELILRLGVGLGGLRQQLAPTRRIGGCSAAEGGEVADTARIASLSRALEQFVRLRLVARDARAGSVEYAEFDHGRGRALVGRLAPGRHRFRRLPVGRVGPPELVHRPARRTRGALAELDGGGDVGGRDFCNALRVGRLVGVGGIGGDAVAQHEIGRLSTGGALRYDCSDADDQQALERPLHEAQVASARRQIQGSSPLSRNAGATSGDARNRSNRSASTGLFVAAIRPAENTAGVCSSYGMGPTTSMPPICFSSLICWTARSASPVTSFSAVKPCWMTCALALMSAAMPSRSISFANRMPLAPSRE